MTTWNESVKRNAYLKTLVATVRKDGHFAILGMLGDAWNATTGEPDSGAPITSAVRLTIPLKLFPLLRSWDSTPAVVFVECLCAAAIQAKLTVFDDVDVCAKLVGDAVLLFDRKRAEAETIQEGFGCDRSAAWATLRKCDDQSAAMTNRMVQIAALAGRMFKTMDYTPRQDPSDSPDHVSGVESGDDVSRLVDEEVALLGVPGAREETLSRLEEKATLQFELEGDVSHGRGPLVIALDESGSMHERRQIWSKAVAVALSRIALGEGRAVRVVHFSMVTVVRDLNPDETDDIRELAWSHLGGGTCIETALNVSVNEALALESVGKKGADIVMVTDGEDSYSERPFANMDSHGIQLWTIAIDCDIRNSPLAKRAQKYLHVRDGSMNSAAGIADLKTAAMDNDVRGLN